LNITLEEKEMEPYFSEGAIGSRIDKRLKSHLVRRDIL